MKILHFLIFIAEGLIFLKYISNTDFPCRGASTCNDCISRGPECAWCSDIGIIKKEDRCFTYSIGAATNCSNIEFPVSKIKLIKSDDKNSLYTTFPRHVDFDIRQGDQIDFNITILLSNDIPLDLYILVDFSKTMEDDLVNLKQLASSIGEKLLNSSRNRIGLGLFVDKPIIPFSGSWVQKCCIPTFSFKHLLSLSSNINEFKSILSTLRISSNIDTQEGTLDAIHQVAVCGDKIGWRNLGQSRRLIFVATDGRVKMAGDGRIAGIVRPPDRKCHLNSSNEYDKDIHFDYPALHVVRDALIENQISVIFAATEDVISEFKEISKIWKGVNTEVSSLSQDSSNILTIMQDLTSKLFSMISLSTGEAENIIIKYETICHGSSMKSHKSGKSCINMKLGGSVIFIVHIIADSRANIVEKSYTSKFQVTGLDTIDVKYRVIKTCNCSSNPIHHIKSKFCNSNGDMVCGECKCKEGWTGRDCDCDPTKVTSILTCKDGNMPNSTICSSRGTCVCGKCECMTSETEFSTFKGDYCQCSDSFCLRYQGLICGGKNRGVCDCNKCSCNPKYSGDNCALKNCSNPDWMSDCIHNNQTCYNNGVCKCGICECNSEYEGKLCQNKIFVRPKCAEYVQCVNCYLFRNLSCETVCGKAVFEEEENFKNNQYVCHFENFKGCKYSFDVNFVDNISIIAIKKFNNDKDCPKPVSLLWIGIGISTTVASIGLVTILIGYYLKRLYNRTVMSAFEEEQKKARWTKIQNPLYTPLLANYNNPIYHKLET